MAMAIGMMVKTKRCLDKSEQKAMIMAKPKAQAHGGTLCSLEERGVSNSLIRKVSGLEGKYAILGNCQEQE